MILILGKSYSLFGSPDRTQWGTNQSPGSYFGDLAGLGSINYLSDDMGLIPRVFSDIIEGLLRKDFSCDDTKVKISFIEICNEKIKDF